MRFAYALLCPCLINAALGFLPMSEVVAGELPRKQADTKHSKSASKTETPRLTACTNLGEGYFRVGDSSTCVKISGYVQADYVYHSAPAR